MIFRTCIQKVFPLSCFKGRSKVKRGSTQIREFRLEKILNISDFTREEASSSPFVARKKGQSICILPRMLLPSAKKKTLQNYESYSHVLTA